MRVIRTVGACAIALALSGVSATVASAAEYPPTGLPELGRCVPVSPGTGRFNFSNCIATDKDGNDGSFEWKPGPGASPGFKATMSTPVVETAGGKRKMICTVAFITGEYLNGKEVKVSNTKIEGCQNTHTGKTCSGNPTEAGVINSEQPLMGTIGFLPNPKNEANPYVGMDLKPEPESLPFVMFECGEPLTGESVKLEGSVIGKIGKTGKMLVEDPLAYTQKLGVQKYEAFKGGLKDTLTETFGPLLNPLERTSEPAALGGIAVLKNGEAIEFKKSQH